MSSPQRNETRKNAFALLMTSSATKKSPPRKHKGESNFVLCENCSKSFAFTRIIAHRQQCIMKDAPRDAVEEESSRSISGHMKGTGETVEESSSEINDCGESHAHGEQFSEKSSHSRKRQRNSLPDLCAAVDSKVNGTISSQQDGNTVPPKRNAFNHMLKSSKKIFSEKKKQKQTFHLSEVDGKLDLQWFCDENDGVPSNNVAWTGNLIIRASKEASDNEQSVELSVTSSIPSEAEFTRTHYVKQHSKLSVPVLKSILQKSIRRRRPKPSVRLAMELADKSFGELIRRLPIICLEDSFLHHEFPFLVWLMIAYSKDYVPPKRLIDKVMQIVFEIASCPWQDKCNHNPPERTLSSFSLSRLAQNDSFHSNDSEQCHLILRSLVLRKKYGGMACDMKMIDQFMDSWSHRFHNRQVDTSIVLTFLRRFPQLNNDIHWKDVPALVHSLTSIADLLPLLKSGFLKLELNDISASGIDFHCSNIMGTLLDRTSGFYKNLTAMIGCKLDAEIEVIVKKMMWDYSSGKNNRRQIFDHKINTIRRPEGEEKLKLLWDREASPLVKKFTDAYISSRLR